MKRFLTIAVTAFLGSNCSYIPFIGLGFDSITSHVLHPLIYILSKRFIGAYSL